MDKVNREHIEEMADKIDPTPAPGWEKMEEAGEQAKQQQHIPSGPDQANPHQDVPEDERLKRPVGTETNSY